MFDRSYLIDKLEDLYEVCPNVVVGELMSYMSTDSLQEVCESLDLIQEEDTEDDYGEIW